MSCDNPGHSAFLLVAVEVLLVVLGPHPLLFLIYGKLKMAQDSHLLEVLQRRNLQILYWLHEIYKSTGQTFTFIACTRHELLTVFEGLTQHERTTCIGLCEARMRKISDQSRGIRWTVSSRFAVDSP